MRSRVLDNGMAVLDCINNDGCSLNICHWRNAKRTWQANIQYRILLVLTLTFPYSRQSKETPDYTCVPFPRAQKFP